MEQSQYIRTLVPDKTFIVVAYIFIDYASFIWVCSPCWHYDSKLPHVFLGTLIDGNNPGYTKNATGYLIGDLLKRVFRGNIVKANVANKPREQTNAHNQMTMKTQMLWTKFLNVFRHMFSLNLFKFWQIVPDFILTSLQNKVFFIRKHWLN